MGVRAFRTKIICDKSTLLHLWQTQLAFNQRLPSFIAKIFAMSVHAIQTATTSPERKLETKLIEQIRGMKYEYRPNIHDRPTIESNVRHKFEARNRVTLIYTIHNKCLAGL